jgi:hypothetical protein
MKYQMNKDSSMSQRSIAGVNRQALPVDEED